MCIRDRVAIIEVNKIGGTCVIRGCVPKKLMVYAANNRRNMVSSEGYGLLSKEITFESNILLKNVREEVSRLSVLHSNSLKKLNVKGPWKIFKSKYGRGSLSKNKKYFKKSKCQKYSYFSWWQTKKIKYSRNRLSVEQR